MRMTHSTWLCPSSVYLIRSPYQIYYALTNFDCRGKPDADDPFDLAVPVERLEKRGKVPGVRIHPGKSIFINLGKSSSGEEDFSSSSSLLLSSL